MLSMYDLNFSILKVELERMILHPLLKTWGTIPLPIQAIIVIIPSFSFLLWFSLQRPVYSIEDEKTQTPDKIE